MKTPTIKNIKQLANFLRCQEDFLTAYLGGDFYIIDHRNPVPPPALSELTTVINKLYLLKKDRRVNKYREIYSVQTDTLKNALKAFNTFLKTSFEPSPAVHGYVNGRNIRTNAEVHLAKKYLLSVDIRKFFESITTSMVEQALQDLGFSSFSVPLLAKFVTVANFLPPGFNTSPTLSNLIVKNMDEQFVNLCEADCAYTRYADDLYFSSNLRLPEWSAIEQIVQDSGFSLHPDKTKYMPRGSQQYVTGLTVFDHVRPHVSRKIKRNLRLQLHYLKKYGFLEHSLHFVGKTVDEYANDSLVRSEVDSFMHGIDMTIGGWLHFMKSVERPAAAKLEALYKKALR